MNREVIAVGSASAVIGAVIGAVLVAWQRPPATRAKDEIADSWAVALATLSLWTRSKLVRFCAQYLGDGDWHSVDVDRQQHTGDCPNLLICYALRLRSSVGTVINACVAEESRRRCDAIQPTAQLDAIAASAKATQEPEELAAGHTQSSGRDDDSSAGGRACVRKVCTIGSVQNVSLLT